MNKLTLSGVGVALVTPFLKNGSIDLPALKRIVEHVILCNVDYLVVLGTTGESATLDESETEAVLQTVINTNSGRKPVLIGCGGYNTLEVGSRMKRYESKFTFDGYMSVVPYYNKPGQNGLFEHFRFLSESTTKPILLYNIPGRTSVNMLPETVLKLHRQCENIIGIKEASGGLEQGMDIIARAHPDFQVLIGDDILALPSLALGFQGCVSVLANAFPSSVSAMMRFIQKEQDYISAKQIHYNMLPLIRLAFAEGNPVGIKAILSVIGLCEPTVRLPLIQASESLVSSIRDTVSLNLPLEKNLN